MSSTQLADRLEAVAAELRAFPTTTDALRILQGLTNAIDAEKVALVADMAEHRDHEAEGCSSLKNWLRDQLHLDAADAAQLKRSATVLRDMPALADLAHGRAKLFVTRVCLALRARRPELFRQGSYVACHGSGEHRELVCAFGRDLGDQGLIAAVPLRVVRLTGGAEIAPVGAAVWGGGLTDLRRYATTPRTTAPSRIGTIRSPGPRRGLRRGLNPGDEGWAMPRSTDSS